MPSIEPLGLAIPSTDDYIVIPSTEDCIVIPYQLHCDSFYGRFHCDSLYKGCCTRSDIVNPFCIVIPFTEDLALGLTLSILLQRIAL